MVNITVIKQKFCTLWFTKLPIIVQTVVHVLYKLRFTMGYALVYYVKQTTWKTMVLCYCSTTLKQKTILLYQTNYDTLPKAAAVALRKVGCSNPSCDRL